MQEFGVMSGYVTVFPNELRKKMGRGHIHIKFIINCSSDYVFIISELKSKGS